MYSALKETERQTTSKWELILHGMSFTGNAKWEPLKCNAQCNRILQYGLVRSCQLNCARPAVVSRFAMLRRCGSHYGYERRCSMLCWEISSVPRLSVGETTDDGWQGLIPSKGIAVNHPFKHPHEIQSRSQIIEGSLTCILQTNTFVQCSSEGGKPR
jgi:hypothetical protein